MKLFGYRSKTPWKMALATFSYGLVLMIIVIAIINPSSEDDNTGGNTIVETDPLKLPIDDFLEYQVNKVMGETTNTKKPTFISVTDGDNNIKVITVNANDNLSADWIRTGMLSKAKDYFKEVIAHDEVQELYAVSLVYYFTLVDQLGNENERVVMIIDVTLETLNKINWSNFTYDNLPNVALTYYQHPAFNK
jgi:hypothetical protein